MLGVVLHHTEYREWLAASDTEEDRQRVDNLDELLTDAREFDEAHAEHGGLEAFLEQASLVSDVDDWNVEIDRVTMMTLHAAKGLEFPVVFIVAVEDDMLPHARSKEHPHQLEEERRLLFVGMTRAKEELHLSAAQLRAPAWQQQHGGCQSRSCSNCPARKWRWSGRSGTACPSSRIGRTPATGTRPPELATNWPHDLDDGARRVLAG